MMQNLNLRLNQLYYKHRQTFSRSTLTAIAATAVDFTTLYTLVEFSHLYYVTATAIGAFLGACTNFTLNKYWAFPENNGALRTQTARYALVSAGSLALNTALVFCFTELGHLVYLRSKIVAAISVGWGWNYPLHRYFVFKSKV